MNKPSDYVRIKLELFEGPLDLLLHLIRVQQIDISAISIAHITDQYLQTIELMKELDLDIAGEYLVMAATLVLIKSRMLLPPAETDQDVVDAEDPREELIRRLREYEVFKKASHHLGAIEIVYSKMHPRPIEVIPKQLTVEWICDVSLVDLMDALKNVMSRQKSVLMHIVKPNPISIRHKMTLVLERLRVSGSMRFSELFDEFSSRQDVIATFLALLELIRIRALRARQKHQSGDIRLALNQTADEVT